MREIIVQVKILTETLSRTVPEMRDEPAIKKAIYMPAADRQVAAFTWRDFSITMRLT